MSLVAPTSLLYGKLHIATAGHIRLLAARYKSSKVVAPGFTLGVPQSGWSWLSDQVHFLFMAPGLDASVLLTQRQSMIHVPDTLSLADR